LLRRHAPGVDGESRRGIVFLNFDTAVEVSGDGVSAREQRDLRELLVRIEDVIGCVGERNGRRRSARLDDEREALHRVVEARVVRQLNPEARSLRDAAFYRYRYVERELPVVTLTHEEIADAHFGKTNLVAGREILLPRRDIQQPEAPARRA